MTNPIRPFPSALRFILSPTVIRSNGGGLSPNPGSGWGCCCCVAQVLHARLRPSSTATWPRGARQARLPATGCRVRAARVRVQRGGERGQRELLLLSQPLFEALVSLPSNPANDLVSQITVACVAERSRTCAAEPRAQGHAGGGEKGQRDCVPRPSRVLRYTVQEPAARCSCALSTHAHRVCFGHTHDYEILSKCAWRCRGRKRARERGREGAQGSAREHARARERVRARERESEREKGTCTRLHTTCVSMSRHAYT